MLKVIKSTDLVNESGLTKQTKFYKTDNGTKYKIKYENSNGSPLGFNNKMSLSQFDPTSGKWNYLDDISILSMKLKIPNYYSAEDSLKHMKEFFEKMEDHCVTIYRS